MSGDSNAEILMSEARAQQLAQGADKGGERIKNLDEVKITTEYLMQNYPKQSQALLNLIQNSEAKLGFRERE